MSITIYGAGAIGGVIGACMARGGEDVLLVDKVTAHVEAINARKDEIYWEDSFTGVGQLGQDTEATPRDVPLHPGAEKWYREHGFKV